MRQPNSNHMRAHNIPRKCAEFGVKKRGCLTKYLLGWCWLFDWSCNDIIIVIHVMFPLRHNNQQGNVQITDTYYFTFHPCQILCNFFWCRCCRCCWVFVFSISFSHPNSLSQWFSLLLFRRLFTLIILAKHIHAGSLFFVSPLLSLIDFDWTKTIIKQQEHSIFNFKKKDWEKRAPKKKKEKEEDDEKRFLSHCQMNWCVLNNTPNIIRRFFYFSKLRICFFAPPHLSLSHLLAQSLSLIHIPSIHFYLAIDRLPQGSHIK